MVSKMGAHTHTHTHTHTHSLSLSLSLTHRERESEREFSTLHRRVHTPHVPFHCLPLSVYTFYPTIRTKQGEIYAARWPRSTPCTHLSIHHMPFFFPLGLRLVLTHNLKSTIRTKQGEIYACALTSVYTFGPTFRAENSHTTRHLAEFWYNKQNITNKQ